MNWAKYINLATGRPQIDPSKATGQGTLVEEHLPVAGGRKESKHQPSQARMNKTTIRARTKTPKERCIGKDSKLAKKVNAPPP